MNLNRTQKTLIGLLTCWPPLYFFLFIAFIFLTFGFFFLEASSGNNSSAPFMGPFAFFPLIFIFHFLTILIVLGLTVFYIVYLFKNDRINQDKKILWLILILLFGIFSMPVFFYFYVWQSPQTA